MTPLDFRMHNDPTIYNDASSYKMTEEIVRGKHSDIVFKSQKPVYEYSKGPMALKYDKVTNFLREKLKVQIPKAPIAMEWLEEPNLARTL